MHKAISEPGQTEGSLHRQVAAFYDADALTYAQRRWFRNPVTRTNYLMTQEALLSALEPQAHETLLEVGCGSGTWTAVVGQRCKRVVALDISERMLEIARQTVTAANVDFVQADFAAWESRTGIFDRAYCVRAFEHFADQRRVLQRFYEGLQPGGKLVIITKTLPSIWNGRVSALRAARRLFTRVSVIPGDGEAQGFWMQRVNPWRLQGWVRAAGFVDVQAAPVIWRLPIYADGEAEYPILRGEWGTWGLDAWLKSARRVRTWPNSLRLLACLGSESYMVWGRKGT